MIVPSVGRKVWYYEDASQVEPIDGTIVRVMPSEEPPHANSLVNVFIVEPGGNTRLIPQIAVGEEGWNIPHYRWMPYQMSQAVAAATPATPTVAPKK